MNVKGLFSVGVFVCSLSIAGTVPKVTFSYAKIFDSLCAPKTGVKIESQWIDELVGRIPELQKEWQDSGAKLLTATTEVIGKEFQEAEIAASLSLCSFPSLHNPLLINMRYSLKSFVATPLTTDVTLSIVFHEILHRYLEGKIPTGSALLAKYKAEDEGVLAHLHLLALQKAVYLKLGLGKTLDEVIRKDESLPNPAYKRAWEIVNSIEDYRSFLREITG